MARGIILGAMKNGKRSSIGDGISLYVNTEMKGLSGGGGITIVVVNRSPMQRTCNVQIDCSGCNNLTSSRDFFVTDDVVRPNSGMIIQMLNILQPNGGFSYSMRTSTRSTQTLPFGLGNSMNLQNVLTGGIEVPQHQPPLLHGGEIHTPIGLS